MTESYFYRVLLVPSAVFLSVVFGASYGSGREVMEFISSNGPTGGLVAIATLASVYVLLLALSFELARMYKCYEYVSFAKVLLKKGWFSYEIVILLGLIIALSITITVGGTVLEDHFGTKAWIGSLAIFVLVVVLNYYGRQIVERSMMLSVAALFVVLAVLVVKLADAQFDKIATSFQSTEHKNGGMMTGLKYAVSNAGYLPLLIYCVIGLRTRAEAFVAGAVAATVATLPAVVFHFAFMAGYPAIVEERLPTYWMFEQLNTPLLLNVYVFVMFVLVAQTGVGLLQGFLARIDAWKTERTGLPMTRVGHGAIAAGVLMVCMALGTMGVVTLILRGYTIMFMSFIVVYVIPLLTYGVYLVYRGRPETVSANEGQG
jgi:uncharacterized membrane protein YkvI